MQWILQLYLDAFGVKQLPLYGLDNSDSYI
jgi:hypothetical protein